MSITVEEIEKLAGLARITLTDAEKASIQGEFDSILEYVASINKATEGAVSSTTSMTSTVNVLRDDENSHESGIHTEMLLSSAPKREGQYVKVKKIL